MSQEFELASGQALPTLTATLLEAVRREERQWSWRDADCSFSGWVNYGSDGDALKYAALEVAGSTDWVNRPYYIYDSADDIGLISGWRRSWDGSSKSFEDSYRSLNLMSRVEKPDGEVTDLQLYKVFESGRLFQAYYHPHSDGAELAWVKLDEKAGENAGTFEEIQGMLGALIESSRRRLQDRREEAKGELPDVETELAAFEKAGRSLGINDPGLSLPAFNSARDSGGEKGYRAREHEHMLRNAVWLAEMPAQPSRFYSDPVVFGKDIEVEVREDTALQEPGSFMKLLGVEIADEAVQKLKDYLESWENMNEQWLGLRRLWTDLREEVGTVDEILDLFDGVQVHLDPSASEQV